MKGIHFCLWGIVPLLCSPWFTNQFFPKVTALYLLACVFCIQLCKSKQDSISREHILIFIMVMVMAMSFSLVHLQYWVVVLLLAIIFSHVEEQQIMTTLYSICAAATLASIYGLYQCITSEYFRVNTFPTYTSSFSMINTAGAFVSCSSILTLILAVVNFPKHTPQLLIAFIVQLSYLLCTGSRAGYVSFAVALFLVGIVVTTRQLSLRRKHFLLILTILIATICISLLYTPVKKQSLSIFDAQNNSNKVRLYMWQSTLNMAGEHLWGGVGSGKFAQNYPLYRNEQEYKISDARVLMHPHNDFLLLVVENGVLILVVFLMLIFLCLRQLFS